MARPLIGVNGVRNQAQFVGDGLEDGQFGLVNIEFPAAFFGLAAGPRIFDERADSGCREPHAALLLVHFQTGDLPQAVRVAFVCLHIVANDFATAKGEC